MGASNWGMVWTAIMPLAVILYYFFRKKYKDQRVSSTLFWQEQMKELQASPYLKKLQHHLLFYLQLAALLLCVLALLGPFSESETLAGNDFIFVVDTSATMLAGSPSHFEKHQQEMKSLAAQAGGKPVSIVTTGASPEVVVRNEQNLDAIEQAVDQLAVSYEKAEMEQTILFADTLAANDSTVIHIFTDTLDRDLLANKTDQSYKVHGVSETLRNLAIQQFGLSETEDGVRGIVQLVNDSDETLSALVRLSAGATEKTVEVELAAAEELLVPFEELPADKNWQATVDVRDDYAADNTMATYLAPPGNAVVIDSALHELIASGFRSLDLDVRLADTAQLQPDSGLPVVTNQSELLEGAVPILLIGRNDETAFEVSGQIETQEHPLFAYAELEEVYVSELYPPFDGYETIALISGQPFIQVSPVGDIVVLSDVESTDWPLFPSFPLFLWSAMNSLSGDEEFLGFFQPNEHRSVSLASDTGEWEIFKDGDYSHSYIEGEGPFIAPSEPGVYEVIGDAETKTLIVQLASEEKTLTAGSSYTMGVAETAQDTVRFSFVPFIILLILLLVAVEWEVYRRGIETR
ncbi:cbb3-type cytochrome oxidase subunit 3 [Planomicrobium stackebrandtii]|uniref:Cbb3-type cytochrome oxidase subunit 3 n=1 Tax=Planomicrobium stackebrandtii TaxID=253160 RepID=A0ABU0GX55_9BACL|nr:BatA and WFA domain-containing protein [Planomicrobium stackebrandtii]MDQ0429130.1 cbb3-type cytochrome oxidase subunit 3 [Planomicrobium stackebrandtii]